MRNKKIKQARYDEEIRKYMLEQYENQIKVPKKSPVDRLRSNKSPPKDTCLYEKGKYVKVDKPDFKSAIPFHAPAVKYTLRRKRPTEGLAHHAADQRATD